MASRDDDIPDLAELSEQVGRDGEIDDADDAKPTGLLGAVSGEGAEGATNPYQPSVSRLVARLDEVAVAPPINDTVRDLRAALGDLQRTHAELELYQALGNPKRRASIEAARVACRVADDQLKATALEQDDPDVIGERELLLAEYRETRRLLQSLPPEPEPKPKPEPEPEPPKKEQSATGGAKASPAERAEGAEAARPKSPRQRADERSSKRLRWLLILLCAAALARVGLFVYDGATRPKLPAVERKGGDVWVSATAPGNGLDRAGRVQGIPSIEWVRMELGSDGALHAYSSATDPNGDTVSVKYFWYDDGLLLMTSSKPLLPKRFVKDGHKYELEAKPYDGKQIGDGLRTAKLTVRLSGGAAGAGSGAGSTSGSADGSAASGRATPAAKSSGARP